MTMLQGRRFRKLTSLLLVLALMLVAAPSYAHAWDFPVLRFLGRVGLGAIRGVGWLGLNAFRGIRWLLGGPFFGYPANAPSETAFAYPDEDAARPAMAAADGATTTFSAPETSQAFVEEGDTLRQPAEGAESCPSLMAEAAR